MRVRRTFAFLDLSGFTALTESEGDERAVAVAVALAAARMERAAGASTASKGETGSRLAPWVANHRARTLSR